MERVVFISIASNNRDQSVYPKHYDYTIPLGNTYRRVKRVEMVSALLPNQSATNILDEPYLVIDIPELNFIEFPSVNKASRGFAILPLKNSTKASGGFINPELGCMFRTLKECNPMISINKISIKIRDMDANYYDFGSSGGSMNKEYQNSFVFKLTLEA